jgi:arsenate reductase
MMTMDSHEAVRRLAALAQDTRLAIWRTLVRRGPAGIAAGRIADHLGLQPSTLSFHLKEMTAAGLLVRRPEGRTVIYSADFASFDRLLGFLTEDCCDGNPCLRSSSPVLAHPSTQSETAMKDCYHVLFLCTGNSARSIMAEALLNGTGGGRFRAWSAGSHPKPEPHPLALAMVRENRLPAEGLRSKSWDEFATPGAPVMDFVFTVCDNAANEACPVWPGQPMTAHWGVRDPAAVEGDEATRRRAFLVAYNELRNRILIFTSLPVDKLDRLALQKKLDDIGRAPAPAIA